VEINDQLVKSIVSTLRYENAQNMLASWLDGINSSGEGPLEYLGLLC